MTGEWKTKVITVDDEDIMFFNRYSDSRSGFSHYSEVEIDGITGSHTCHYLNRTWESYPYQSAMRGAVNVLIDYREEQIKEQFRQDNNIKRISDKRKTELNQKYNTDEKLIFLNKLLKAVDEYRGY